MAEEKEKVYGILENKSLKEIESDIKNIVDGENVNSLKQISATVSGNYASAFGTGIASGQYAHAEGYQTTAGGNSSHAEGYSTTASGFYAHAEGNQTTASGSSSHAEGYKTTANGNYTHAEGQSCYADGRFGDHAGGSGSVAASNDTVLWIAKAEGTEITIDSSGKYQPASDVKTILEKFEAEQELLLLNAYYADSLFHNRKVVSVDVSNYKIVVDSAVPTENTTYRLLINPAVANAAKYFPNYAEGTRSVSIGRYSSHAEGYETVSGKDASHAEGYKTIAVGADSHAEGRTTTAKGSASHAEGSNTTANGSYSHAEGYNTTAEVDYTHAEGNRTTASGNASHAEGDRTTASGNASHAEGDRTTASGNASHAEGYNTTASGDYAHAEGHSTTASGDYTHAEGVSTTAEGDYAHAEGYKTTASGDYAHAEGYNTTAEGSFSHAEGRNTNASNSLSHAEGDNTTAGGSCSHAEGNATTAMGNNSHAEGLYTIASGYSSHAEGVSTTAGNDYAHAEGYGTTANGGSSHAEGYSCYADGQFGDHAGGNGSVAVSNDTVLWIAKAEGTEITIDSSGKYQPASDVKTKLGEFEAGQELFLLNVYYANAGFHKKKVVSVNAANYKIVIDSAVPTEKVNFKLLINPAAANTAAYYPNYAQGTKCISIGGYSSYAEGYQTVALGNSSHGEGFQTTASGNYTHAEGYSTIASGDYAHAEGYSTIASGRYAHAEGSQTNASGEYAHAEGSQTNASGAYSHAGGYLTEANGTCSYAEGYTITANGWQHAAGKFNTSASGASSVSSTSGSAFVIGNGTSASAKSNCFRVQYNGQVFGKGAYSSSGADYAELFEWADGNESAQDRRGKFVALQGTKIHIANSFDDNIIGIISHKPSVMGNNHSETWANMYLTDMWGEEKTERKIIPATYREEKQEDGSIKKIQITEAYEDDVPIINPAYDPSKKYIPRHERKEWGIVGMLGQLIVEDDGTCQAEGYCCCTKGGIATNAEKGYYVMERITEKYIRVLFR